MTTDITELALITKIKKQLENFDTVVLKEGEAIALVEALEKAQRAGNINNQWKPDACPITGRRFFMWIEHPELGYVPTYGGPYDSYTIPTRDGDGEFSCERYDHDVGGWVDGECVGVYLIDDDEQSRVYELEQRIAELEPINAAAEKLVRCKGRYHSELNYRALADLFGVTMPDLPPLEHENVHYADAAEMEIAALRQRIAELESRTVTAPQNDYFSSLVALARVSADKAMKKFPQPNYVLLKVAEEAGEVVQAGVHYAENRMEWKQVEGEIVQLLAMLIRLVTEGDQINGVTPPASCAAGIKVEAE
ncbi:hypothetical protein [Klebsiella michiganensis]